MSPRKISRLGLIVTGMSIIGLVPTLFLSAQLGLWRWWPAGGFGLALLLFGAAFLRGAYLTAQRRVELVDMLNDCYQGNGPARH
jgi:hypothetical protein